MFLAIPGTGLYLSTLPLAWACRAAGHEVLLVNNGEALQHIAQAGLTAVDACPGLDLWGQFIERNQARGTFSAKPDPGRKPPPGLWGWFGEHMAEGALAVAKAFKPDVLVATLEQGAGRIVAAALGRPLIEQSVRLAWGGDDARAQASRDGIAEYLQPTMQRLGIGALAAPHACLDLRPPSLSGAATSGADGAGSSPSSKSDKTWSIQPVPYNGAKVIPQWVVQAPPRPRVVLTLGSVVPVLSGVGGFKDAVAAIASLDIELVLALGNFDLSSLGALPDNVRNAGWMPLSALMPTTAAIVHHGGAATCLTPFFYGVPQLALPKGADQPQNAQVVAASGAGLALVPDEATADDVRAATQRLLGDAAIKAAAVRVQREIAAMPPPAAVAARLAELG